MGLLKGKAVAFDGDEIREMLLAKAATDGLAGHTTDRQYLAVIITELHRLNANLERLLLLAPPSAQVPPADRPR